MLKAFQNRFQSQVHWAILLSLHHLYQDAEGKAEAARATSQMIQCLGLGPSVRHMRLQ